MTIIETIAALVGVAAVIGALAVWAMTAIIAPLNVVIENNTQAMNRVISTLDSHTEKLEDHGNRIVKIETIHEIEGREV